MILFGSKFILLKAILAKLEDSQDHLMFPYCHHFVSDKMPVAWGQACISCSDKNGLHFGHSNLCQSKQFFQITQTSCKKGNWYS